MWGDKHAARKFKDKREGGREDVDAKKGWEIDEKEYKSVHKWAWKF